MGLHHLRPYLELEAVCPNPVLIIGSPRSGTTALGHALGRHPELWASKECYVLHDLFGGGRASRSWESHMERKNPSWLRAQGVEREELLGFLGLGINALYSSRSGGRRWVDPTPLNTPDAADLAAMFPGASFVHIVRDGRRVVRSMGGFREMLESKRGPMTAGELPSWADDFARGCETWVAWVQAALDLEDAKPDRCLTVRNEDLEEDPDALFERISRFLGIESNEAPAQFFSETRVNSSFTGAHGPGPDEWWSPRRRAEFVRIAGGTLERAGYAGQDELEEWVRGEPASQSGE